MIAAPVASFISRPNAPLSGSATLTIFGTNFQTQSSSPQAAIGHTWSVRPSDLACTAVTVNLELDVVRSRCAVTTWVSATAMTCTSMNRGAGAQTCVTFLRHGIEWPEAMTVHASWPCRPTPSLAPCQVPAPVNGALGWCTETVGSGFSCTPICNHGYATTEVYSCTAGALSPSRVECSASACSVSAPANGVLGTCMGLLPSGSSCTPTCQTGYVLSGQFSCSLGSLLSSATCEQTPAATHRCPRISHPRQAAICFGVNG